MSFFKELSKNVSNAFAQEFGLEGTHRGPDRIVLVGSQEQENEIRNLHLTTFHGRDDLEVYSRVNLPGPIEENQRIQHERPTVLHPQEGTEDYQRRKEFENVVSFELGRLVERASHVIVVNRQPDGDYIKERRPGDITVNEFGVLMETTYANVPTAFVNEIPLSSGYSNFTNRGAEIIPDGDIDAYVQQHWPRPQQED